MENQVNAKSNSSMHIIAYITLIGLIIAFISNSSEKNELTSYHIRQSLGIGLLGLSLSVIGIIPIIGWIVSILGAFVVLYMWIIGLFNAINHRKLPVPIFGKKFESLFQNI